MVDSCGHRECVCLRKRGDALQADGWEAASDAVERSWYWTVLRWIWTGTIWRGEEEEAKGTVSFKLKLYSFTEQ